RLWVVQDPLPYQAVRVRRALLDDDRRIGERQPGRKLSELRVELQELRVGVQRASVVLQPRIGGALRGTGERALVRLREQLGDEPRRQVQVLYPCPDEVELGGYVLAIRPHTRLALDVEADDDAAGSEWSVRGLCRRVERRRVDRLGH